MYNCKGWQDGRDHSRTIKRIDGFERQKGWETDVIIFFKIKIFN